MTTESILFALIGLIMTMMIRGIFILMHVYHGLNMLHTTNEVKEKGYYLILKRYVSEGVVLIVFITALAIALFLFVHDEMM